ncbi:hypothetical protein HYH03_011406 [Edaphochlamys debaryana]|uniref:J domain-containing protein n=1 Tax=Edaphochlamys debaryana TaxID=47281 RepID=A0A835Y051_9CHLO|nr:hypothetical protein HYH03_011406 [Edaphochlamys debaryana]|eukprot:KAG2490100.1 hypothetical protein HYH03_011406 [Edaphochlamys debaryana]
MWGRSVAPGRLAAARRVGHVPNTLGARNTPRPASILLATHYDRLGVNPTASADEIKSAFRKQAKLLHPDVSKSGDSEEDFIKVKEAYETLSDECSRAEYDDELKRASRRRSGAAAGPSGRGARTRVVHEDSDGVRIEVEWSTDSPFGDGSFVDLEDLFEFGADSDDDDEYVVLDPDEIEDATWAAMPGNLKSSFQSSWQANSRKPGRGAQAGGRGRGGQHTPLTLDEKEMLFRELPGQVRAAAQQMFGARLQKLKTLEELADLVEAVEELNAMGIAFETYDDPEPSIRGSASASGGGGRRRSAGGAGGGRAGGGGGRGRAAAGGRGGAGGGRKTGGRSGGQGRTRRSP